MRSHQWLRSLVNKRSMELGLANAKEFADHFNLGRSTLYNLLNDPTFKDGRYLWSKPNTQTVVDLAKALGVGADWLLLQFFPEAPRAEEVGGHPFISKIPIGIAGWVGAGPEQDDRIEDTIYIDKAIVGSKDLVAFRVRGDSMDAGKNPIQDGDIILVDTNDKGTDAQPIVARLRNDGYVCKLLKDDKFGWNLYSLNAMYTNGTPPRITREEVAEVVGRVLPTRIRTKESELVM